METGMLLKCLPRSSRCISKDRNITSVPFTGLTGFDRNLRPGTATKSPALCRTALTAGRDHVHFFPKLVSEYGVEGFADTSNKTHPFVNTVKA